MKTSVFIATSLDGFIARPNGNIDWLIDPQYDIEGEDFGYSEFISTVDAIIMGRNSYDKVLTFDEWYYTKPVMVLTSRALEIPDRLIGKVSAISGSVQEVTTEMESRGHKHLYIDGGNTIQQFLSASLIDELTITLIPVLIGEGIPLFGSLPNDLKLEYASSKSYPNGLVQLTYKTK